MNIRVTVCPANAFRSNDFCTYPLALFRLENVASVVDPACTVSVSAAVVPVSALSMCRKKVNV